MRAGATFSRWQVLAVGVAVAAAGWLAACSGDVGSGDGGPGPSDGPGNPDTPTGQPDQPSGTDQGGPGPDTGGPGPDGTILPGNSPVLGGCSVFPADDDWNIDVSELQADAEWTQKFLSWVGDINTHPDFGGPYGIPINIVPADQAAVNVNFVDYPEESDPSPYPLPDPASTRVEGGTATACDGDCHVLVVQQGACVIYEGFACYDDNGWNCSGGAKWDMTRASYGQREKGWTSADAAGLSITAGLLRYEEVMAGAVNHAIRFTTSCTRNNYVRPATHRAVPGDCDPDDPNAPPMGLRVRIRADFDISGFGADTQVVLSAMQRHGLILADNGSNLYFQGEQNDAWPDTLIEELKQIPSSAFEAVAVPPLEP
jgi:hypothetical protein